MIEANVVRAVGEAFAAHDMEARPDEKMPAAVARALDISESDAGLWLKALEEGCPVAEANRRVGIASHKEGAPWMNTLARLIGGAVGSVASAVGKSE
ncbi:MAG: hypothetical protein JWN34_876 [Bryobacterales bacterium]|jgi:hypothetical protein|nr:hypothetical protein [Bryobacterales bacterium]